MARNKNSNQATQICDTCGDSLPLDAAHFDRKRGTSTGFRSTCKTCRHEERSSGITIPGASENNAAIDLNRKLDEKAIDALSSFVSGPGTRVPHIAEMWEALAEVFGGPRGIAQQVMATYLAASPGSDRRVKIIGMLARMAASTTASGATTRRVEDMDDEELAKYVAESSVRMVATQSPVIIADIMRAAGMRVDGDMAIAFSAGKVVDAVATPSPPVETPPPVSASPVATPPPASPEIGYKHDDEIEAAQSQQQDNEDSEPAPTEFQIPKIQPAGIIEICPVMGTPTIRRLREVKDASEL